MRGILGSWDEWGWETALHGDPCFPPAILRDTSLTKARLLTSPLTDTTGPTCNINCVNFLTITTLPAKRGIKAFGSSHPARLVLLFKVFRITNITGARRLEVRCFRKVSSAEFGKCDHACRLLWHLAAAARNSLLDLVMPLPCLSSVSEWHQIHRLQTDHW